MEKIMTGDRTESFHNHTVGESYHSHTGAIEEALLKYAIPCKIKELAVTGKIRILDFCFGLGYNSAKAIDVALKENPDCQIEVIGLENDAEIIFRIQEVNPPLPIYEHYKNIKQGNSTFTEGNVTVKVILGDAKRTIRGLRSGHFDAIFFDPFSPKKMPEMWSVEMFKEVHRVLKPKGILATYSCARVVRENMQKAGLVYDDGPAVHRRGPGTLAFRWE